MIKAQLVDGRTLEFPDGTEQNVIDRAVRIEMGLQPTEGTDPISTLTPPTQEPPTLYIGPEPPAAEPAEPVKPLGERILEEIPQVGGGIVGGIAAAPAAAAAAAAVGGGGVLAAGTGLAVVAGAVAAGAGAGEAYKQLGQQLSGSLDAPKTSLEAAKRIGVAALTEGGFDLVGGLVAKGFGKIIAPLKNKMIKEGVDAIDLFKDKLKPVVLLPAEATESRVLDLLQNVSESSIVGGSSIQNFKTQRVKFFDDFADSLINEFGKRTDPTDLGNLFVTSISNSKAVHSKAAKILYNSVKAGRTKTATSPLKNFAKPLQRRAMKLEGIEAKNAGDDLVDAVMDLPDRLSYKEATELRSRLISRINEFSILNKKAPAIGKAKKMVGLLDKAIGKSLKGVGPAPYEAWRTANRFYKDGQKKFNNTLLRRLVKLADDTGTGAEMIAPAIFKPRHVTSVRKVKLALKDDPETWHKMQGFFMEYIMQKSSDKNKNLVGTLLINNISDKPGSFGLPMLKEVFTEPQIKALETFGKAVKLTQERQAQGAGRVLIQLTQAGALGAIMTGNLTLPAATIIIAPAVMAKMMLNPQMAKMLTVGLTLPAKAPEAAGIMSRLAAAAWRIQMESENETVK